MLLDIGRESVRSADDEDALLAETEALVAEATGLAGAEATGTLTPPPMEQRTLPMPLPRRASRAAGPKSARA